MANLVCEVYTTSAAFHTAIEAVDDTKIKSCFAVQENGMTKFVIVKAA